MANVSPMTIVAWVYFTGTPSYSARILNKQNTNGWLFDVNASSSTALNFSVIYATTNLSVITSTTPSTGAWHLLILTWDGSTTAANVHIYIDNTEASYATQTNAVGTRNDDTSQVLQIGNRDSDEARAFPGYITQVAIIGSVLNSTQRTEIYDYGLTGQPSSTNHGFAGFLR